MNQLTEEHKRLESLYEKFGDKKIKVTIEIQDTNPKVAVGVTFDVRQHQELREKFGLDVFAQTTSVAYDEFMRMVEGINDPNSENIKIDDEILNRSKPSPEMNKMYETIISQGEFVQNSRVDGFPIYRWKDRLFKLDTLGKSVIPQQ